MQINILLKILRFNFIIGKPYIIENIYYLKWNSKDKYLEWHILHDKKI